MPDLDKMTIEISEDVVDASVGAETVLLQLASSTYFGLDEVGTFIWDRLKSAIPLAQIRSDLVDTYGILPDRAASDIQSLVTELVEHEIVQTRDSQ